MQHEAGQFVSSGIRERRRRVEAPANLRRVDPEQSNPPERRDVDGVAIKDGANQHGIRSIE